MKKRIVIIILSISVLFLNACQKDIDLFQIDNGQLNGPDTTWHHAITNSMPVSVLKNDIWQAPYYDSINVDNYNIITLGSGVKFYIPQNCCINKSGQTVTGKVYVEAQLINRKGDMIRMNQPTTSLGELLVSDGQIFLRLTKDKENLQLAPNKNIFIEYLHSSPNSDMEFFIGDQSNPNYFNWLTNPDIINNYIITDLYQYKMFTNNLGWISLNYFDNTSIKLSTIIADIPDNYTNANTIIFIVFKNFNSVVNMYPDVPSKKFIIEKIPSGEKATVIALSKQVNDYYLGYQDIVTNSGGGEQQITIRPIKKSLTDILYYLSTLH